MSDKVLIPGEYVGPGEVYEEGASTHLEGDDIHASTVGVADESEGKFKAKASKPPLKPGDIIYGTVIIVMDSFAIIIIYPPEKDGKFPAAPPEGKIHVRSMSSGFTASTRDALRVGDIIRAKVVKIEGEKAELSMVDPNLGAIKAFCSQCREPLDKTSKGLVCKNGHREKREITNDYRAYGKIML